MRGNAISHRCRALVQGVLDLGQVKVPTDVHVVGSWENPGVGWWKELSS